MAAPSKPIHYREEMERLNSQFSSETREHLFLLRQDPGKGYDRGDFTFRYLRALAWVDGTSGELHDECGSLRWLIPKRLFAPKEAKLEALHTYRFEVRENRTDPNSFLVVKMIGKAKDERLEEIRRNYETPVTVTNALGTFRLNRAYDWYEGDVDYCGETISVMIETVPGKTDAEAGFRRLGEVLHDAPKFDKTVRERIAKEEILWEWLEDAGIDHDGFEQRLGNPGLTIGLDGGVSAWFDGGDPFGGHSIVVSVDPDGTCTDVDLQG